MGEKRLLRKHRMRTLIQWRKENQKKDLERSVTGSKETILSTEMGEVGQEI